MTASAKGLFRATKPKPPVDVRQAALCDLPDQRAPDAPRDPLDFDPTPPEATRAFIHVERRWICRHGGPVWEAAVGDGRMARVLRTEGFDVIATDIVDRGWPGTETVSLYDVAEAPARVMVTNPPYNEINARDGHGRWLKHAFALRLPYVALLLNADWPAARINGMDALLEAHPPSIEYLCCWKIDFRGGGSPPQRNSWFVWDANRPPPAPGAWLRRRLYKEAGDPQEAFL